MQRLMKIRYEDYLRSIMFGFQDALVSTTGSIAGVAIGTGDKHLVILVGLVVVTVEALSMGVGEFTSEQSVHQLDKIHKHPDNLYLGGLFMIISYLAGGFIPLLPILFFQLPFSLYLSIIFALIGLFILGFIKAKLVGISPLRSGLEILMLGGIATVMGVIVGAFFKLS